MLVKATKIILISSALFSVGCGVTENLENLGEGSGTEERGERETTESMFSSFYQNLGLSETETEGEEVTETTPEESLSADALAVFESVKAIKDGYKAEMEAICAKDTELRESIKTQLDAIKANDELTDAQKREQAQAVFEANKSAVEAEKAEFKACVEENKEALFAIKELDKSLSDACLIRPKHSGAPQKEAGRDNSLTMGGRKPGPEGSDGLDRNRRPRGHQGQGGQGGQGEHKGPEGEKRPQIQWDDELIAELSAALLTDACSEAVASAESTEDE